jgi:hypothetical protein
LTRDQPSARRHHAQLPVEQHQRPHRRGSGPQSHLSSLITGRRSTPTARRPSFSRCCISQGNEPGSLSDISCSKAPKFQRSNVFKVSMFQSFRVPRPHRGGRPRKWLPIRFLDSLADINSSAATHC